MTWADLGLHAVNGAFAPAGKLAPPNNFRDKMQLATVKSQVELPRQSLEACKVLSLQTSSLF